MRAARSMPPCRRMPRGRSCYDHTSHLFRLGDAFTEVSRPEISVHSGTAFFFDGDYLYACAPDEVSAVSLTSGSVDALLSFAVG